MCACLLVRYFLGSLFFGHLSLHCFFCLLHLCFPLPSWSPFGVGRSYSFCITFASGFPLPWLASSGGDVSVFLSSPLFVCSCLPGFRSLRLPLTIFRSSFFSLRFLLAASACVVIYAFWFLFPLFVSFLALFYVGGLGLCSVLPGHGLCPCSSSAILVYFLRCFLPFGLYFRPFSSFFGFSSHPPCCLIRISVPSWRGRPLGRVSCFGGFLRPLLRVFSGSLSTDIMCVIFLYPFLLLFFSGLLWVSSLPLLCAVFCFVASLEGVWRGSLSSSMGFFLRLCLSCSSLGCVMCILYMFKGASLGFIWLPLWFSFHSYALPTFPMFLCCSFVLFLMFRLRGGCLRGVVPSPLAVYLYLSSSLLCLCDCLAWHSCAPAPSPLGCCVYVGFLPYRSLCL